MILHFMLFLLASCHADRYHPKTKSTYQSSSSSEDIDYWVKKGEDELTKATSIQKIESKAKNIILFIGDGMSLPTLTASRIYKAQREVNFDGSVNGEESLLFFETLPHVGLSKTYSIDRQTTDSAASATSMVTGVKTNVATH